MAIYNLRTLSGYYQITKFDDDLNVENSYEASETKCNCPAGSRGKHCRHKQMIQMFTTDRIDQGWFLDFDRKMWVNPWENVEEAVSVFKRRI